MKKMVVTVTEYDLLRSIVNDAAVDANEREAIAKQNESPDLPNLRALANSIDVLRKEIDQAHQFR